MHLFGIPGPHPSDTEVEQYVLGGSELSELPDVIQMETHLLICLECVRRAEEAVEFRQAIRDAIKILEVEVD
jgi:hypothetical protein